MNAREYYRKIRAIEQSLDNADAVVASLATADGGKEGVLTEVPRRVGASLIAEGRARLATPEETERFLADKARAHEEAEQRAAASRVQVTVVSESELRAWRQGTRNSKGN